MTTSNWRKFCKKKNIHKKKKKTVNIILKLIHSSLHWELKIRCWWKAMLHNIFDSYFNIIFYNYETDWLSISVKLYILPMRRVWTEFTYFKSDEFRSITRPRARCTLRFDLFENLTVKKTADTADGWRSLL